MTVQIAGALLMIVGAALFSTSLQRVWREDPGFDPGRAARLRVHTPRTFDFPSVLELLQTIERVPGVVAAAGLNEPFLERAITGSGFRPPDTARETGDVEDLSVTSGYFRAAGLELIDGRLPTAEEFDRGEPVVVVSRTVAEAYWPDQRAIGQVLTDAGRGYVVLAVVEDARYRALDLASEGEIYSPLAPRGGLANVVVAFESRDGERLRDVVAAIRTSHPQVRVSRAETVREAMASSIRLRRLQTWVFGSMGLTALLVTLAGIVGIVGMSAARRTREVGVRIALGATRSAVVTQMMREQTGAVLAGLVAGSLLAAWAAGFVRAYLYKMSPFDPLPWSMAIVTILVVALLGTLVPVLRATNVDPVTALRAD